MSIKYFYAQNVGQPVAGVRFEKYDIVGGTAVGVYKTENETEIASLEALMAAGKTSVQAIDEAEYERCLKKKPRSFDDWKPSNPLVTLPAVAMKGQGAVLVEHSEPPEGVESTIEVAATVVDIEDALRVEAIKPPEGSLPDPMAPKADTREAFANKKRRK